MNGFKNMKLNAIFQKDAIDQITDYVLVACQEVKNCYSAVRKKLPNDENQIRSILLNEYMAIDENQKKHNMSDFRFEPETQEHYTGSGNYLGRADIKVVLLSDFAKNNAYYLVECKRLDGTRAFNKKYVAEGVNRFVTQKYSSFYAKNMMLGFIVSDIDIHDNAMQIEIIQNFSSNSIIHGNFQLLSTKETQSEIYSCQYRLIDKILELRHIFFNLNDVV